MACREMEMNLRDESVFVDWFLSFSFWCFYPHLLVGRMSVRASVRDMHDIIGVIEREESEERVDALMRWMNGFDSSMGGRLLN